MWALLVESRDELIEARLLLQEVLGSGLGSFILQCQMRTLVATGLLRMAGLDALEVDPEPSPPDRQAGQAEERIGAMEN